jgi:hypothetical protein
MPLLLDDEVVDVGMGVPPVVSPALPRPNPLIAMEVFLSSKMGMNVPLPIRPERLPLERKIANRLVTADVAPPAARP